MDKKLLIFTLLFMLLFVSFVSADICQRDEVLNGLRKALYVYYNNPSGSAFTEGELKNLLTFYIGISSGQITVDCTNEQKSKVAQAQLLIDNIPSCSDGTKYGKCSNNKPIYCYAGNLVPRCRLCGCPKGQMCDITYVYTEKGNKGQWGKCNPGDVVCSINSDCGINSYIGNYYCENGDVYRERITHFCVGDDLVIDDVLEVGDELVVGGGAPYCYNSTPSVLIDDCEINEICMEGQSECQTIISDGPPTVAITVTPTTVVQGQLFNVTVIGTDDVGLNMVWWWGSSTGDAELNKAHMYSCNSAKFCMNSWLVSTNATGTLKLEANSRDTAYANLLACQKGLPECTCLGDITQCPGYGEPHQASEGAGIAYATITVTSALTNTSNQTCTDSDNGYDFYKYGEVKDITGNTYKDTCITDLSGLSEFVCGSDGLYSSQFHSCVNENKICTQGACVASAGNSWCYDPDGGYKFDEYSIVSYSVEGKNYSYADTCADEYGVSEGACDNKQWVTQFHSCVNENKVCSQGACVTSIGNSSCYDSDGGYNFNTYGSVSYSVEGRSYSYADVCVNEYALIEAACSNKQWTTQYHSCIADGKVCQNGACINQTTSKPDLIVSDITFSPTNPTTTDYTNVYFIIKNIGSATAWNFSTKVEYVGGQSFLFGTGALPPGATTQPGYLTNYWPAGTNTFTATVDINNNVAEIDENNNILTKSLTVTPTSNQTGLKTYAEPCTNGIECKYLLACISDPLDNNVGKCGWWGAYANAQQCSAGYYPSLPCMCGNITIYAGACNHGIFYWPPTQSGRSIGSSCTDSSQCSTGICIFGLCSYAVRCSPSTPGYCHDHEECVAYGAGC